MGPGTQEVLCKGEFCTQPLKAGWTQSGLGLWTLWDCRSGGAGSFTPHCLCTGFAQEIPSKTHRT